jgi:isopentenyl-diphosphate delta-isomerase type 1
MKDEKEILEVIDGNGNVLRLATRLECHTDPTLLHRVVHCLVFNEKDELFLQKRALNKMTQPGKWDTSVGGHIDPGEKDEDALARETREELGFDIGPYEFLYGYVWKCPQESELVKTYRTTVGDPGRIRPDSREVMEGKFWKMEELLAALKKKPEIFTPNLIHEITLFRSRHDKD